MFEASGTCNAITALENAAPGDDPTTICARKKRDVSRKHLVNMLNYLNFKDETILVNLKHSKYDTTITLKAKPLPCLDAKLECVWVQFESLEQKLKTYRYESFIVPDPHEPLHVKARLVDVTSQGIIFLLPDKCTELSSRRISRFRCSGVDALLIQNGAMFSGELSDFSPASFRILIECNPPQSFQWVVPESPVHLIFRKGQQILYSGDCAIIKQTCGHRKRSFVLKPLLSQIRRFKPKDHRSPRHRLVPSPNVVFDDPLTGRMVNLKVIDISGSGFSVEEREDSAVLMPGRVIPELRLDLANIFTFSCRAQVVYRLNIGEKNGKSMVRCGLAILDADIGEHMKLLALLHQASDENSYVCNKVDMESLWGLFFQTGFVYPEKYAVIEANKEVFRETYEKLYNGNPRIARHFVYQSCGVIYGHMAMLRFCGNTWLIHHHAAHKSQSLRAGLVVLNQISHAINDSHNLYSAHMDFVLCYYRFDNRFPKHVFGDFAHYLDDPKGCSIDQFAYFHYERSSECDQWDLSGAWNLAKSKPDELLEFEGWYSHVSGGLLVSAFDLDSGVPDDEELGGEYRKAGFRKERTIFSLKNGDTLKAVFIVNVSDIGLNLSELTCSITAMIIDPDDLPKGTLFSILSFLSKYYDYENIPVLLYPVEYADNKLIHYKKKYNLWILNVQESGAEYLGYMSRFHGRVAKY